MHVMYPVAALLVPITFTADLSHASLSCSSSAVAFWCYWGSLASAASPHVAPSFAISICCYCSFVSVPRSASLSSPSSVIGESTSGEVSAPIMVTLVFHLKSNPSKKSLRTMEHSKDKACTTQSKICQKKNLFSVPRDQPTNLQCRIHAIYHAPYLG